MNKIQATILVLALGASPAFAQERVDKSAPANPTGVVEIENVSGSVRVIGWNRDRVQVEGTLGRGTERLDFEAGTQRTSIRVVLPRHCHDCDGSDLEIHVPMGSRVEVEAVSADVSVRDVQGMLLLKSVSGEVMVTGDPKEVDARSVSGDVEISAVSAPVRAKSVSGDVRIRGAEGDVEAGSVSGEVLVEGGMIDRGEFGTTSGDIVIDGDLGPTARIDVKTVSGNIDFLLPASVGADFEISSFSGDIRNAFGPGARRVSRYTSEKELTFTAGSGGARVTARSFSGDVRLRRR